ncbi:AraC family transcriptional regulator [Pseudoneobacillus rhizosphaerae]|uniref:AraC family transcriptional regulator n=1 Tax=Pseudoneobacillus rhizosphaerae TaxID=2880968 RepID=A0A9C7L9K2_9BACI|nr:AraC family transcriptional regulator [Pseudoneobacillus rhizosphaerae]CAG9606510.1 hypothetical protein NEOCIP111885_00198 [Pseudoneobacillus rhizosphaerae]
MINQNTLNILNGQAMYNYFQKTDFLKQEIMIPFNEAMCYGNTSKDLFSDEFVEIRSNVHHVTPSQYTEIAILPLQPLFSKNFTNIALWFDADMFCQINLITILAWLDKNEYKGKIVLHLVGENFEPEEHFNLEANGYYELYNQVLIHKTSPDFFVPPPLKKGIELYLHYLNNDSDLMTYIEMNRNVSEKELVYALIENFKDYGLGDTQYLEIIKGHHKTNHNI